MLNFKQDHLDKNFVNSKAYYRYIKKITGVKS
jgi:hypothetical protein